MSEEEEEEEEALHLPSPRRPLWMSCLPLLTLAPVITGCCPCVWPMLTDPRLAEALGGVPREVLGLAFFGTWAMFVATFVTLMFLYEGRWRDARLDAEGVKLGFVRHRWRSLRGFACRADSVRLVLAYRPWTRWIGPVLWCEGQTLSTVVDRLEAHGVRRLDE